MTNFLPLWQSRLGHVPSPSQPRSTSQIHELREAAILRWIYQTSFGKLAIHMVNGLTVLE